jgi:hypothetical protein
LVGPSIPELLSLVDAADGLTAYGVQTRYPGDWQPAGPDEMDRAVRSARQFGTLLIHRIEQWTKS